MHYLGLILFLWILGGTGVMAAWADRIAQRSTSHGLFRPAGPRLEP